MQRVGYEARNLSATRLQYHLRPALLSLVEVLVCLGRLLQRKLARDDPQGLDDTGAGEQQGGVSASSGFQESDAAIAAVPVERELPWPGNFFLPAASLTLGI